MWVLAPSACLAISAKAYSSVDGSSEAACTNGKDVLLRS
jgi:hypothetical protein